MMAEAFEIIGHCDDRADWLKLRQEGIGGSDAAGVLGLSPWSSPVSVFADKVLGSEEFDNESMYWGRTLEPVLLAEFEKETGRNTHRDGRLLRSIEHPFMQVTLDGVWITTEGDQDTTGFVEVKNTRFHMRDGVPQHYWIQIQHQFAVTGWARGSFAVLVMGSEFFWMDVERDETFIQETLIPRLSEFWDRVQARGPTPSADPSDATLEALKRIYPRDNGETIELDGEWLDVDLRRQELTGRRTVVATALQAIENRIKAEIGDASAATLPNGRTYTWKANVNGVRTFRAPKNVEE